MSPGGAGGEYSFISTANGNAFIAGPTPIMRPVVALGQGAGIEASSNGQTKKRGIKDLVEPRVRPQYHSGLDHHRNIFLHSLAMTNR